MSYRNYNKRSSPGFSIIEVMISIFIFILIGMTAWTFQENIFSLNNVLSSSLSMEEEVRRAFKMITAEIRSASPSSAGSYPIAAANSTSFTFYSDIDDDGLKERIRYFLDGNALKKGVLEPSGDPLSYNPNNETINETFGDIANGVTPLFSYYDTNYDGSTPALTEPVNVTAVRLVKITVIIDRDSSRPPGPITLTTQVSMRNLKDNL